MSFLKVVVLVAMELGSIYKILLNFLILGNVNLVFETIILVLSHLFSVEICKDVCDQGNSFAFSQHHVLTEMIMSYILLKRGKHYNLNNV